MSTPWLLRRCRRCDGRTSCARLTTTDVRLPHSLTREHRPRANDHDLDRHTGNLQPRQPPRTRYVGRTAHRRTASPRTRADPRLQALRDVSLAGRGAPRLPGRIGTAAGSCRRRPHPWRCRLRNPANSRSRSNHSMGGGERSSRQRPRSPCRTVRSGAWRAAQGARRLWPVPMSGDPPGAGGCRRERPSEPVHPRDADFFPSEVAVNVSWGLLADSWFADTVRAPRSGGAGALAGCFYPIDSPVGRPVS